ncbi:siderophore-interacting protein [Asticcacaulis sp. 201]|uniref:siderophore-interacting protein n=1 Tax=Asticcacaulis sp. 201 TaxID=3028787 RepID=UPI002916ADF3|nr:siderophore-interacting protein [Asticcacaulis sp. 201]MDV6329990.1 siderophore-interacting protein [Asticcacaulis sp. 201]
MTETAFAPDMPMPRPPGLIDRTLRHLLMRPARVGAITTLSPRFRLLELEGAALQGVVWTPGQKIQVAMNANFSARTYTPISWDADIGTTRILVYSHGLGPGACWAEERREGDTCHFFGPRPSLDIANIPTPVVVFGDETSFGLAAATRTALRNTAYRYVLETSDLHQSRSVLASIGLADANLIGRRGDNAHLAAIETELIRSIESGAHFVLTGKATSIQHFHRTLKRLGVRPAHIKTKAYWAPGKVGLD